MFFEFPPGEKREHRRKLAFRRPPATAVAPLFGSASGRTAGSLRGSRSWFSLFAHKPLLVITDSFSSQFGVQENPRARELVLNSHNIFLPITIPERPRIYLPITISLYGSLQSSVLLLAQLLFCTLTLRFRVVGRTPRLV